MIAPINPIYMCVVGVALSLYSGVLSVGLGDMVAAVVGSRWGKHSWLGKCLCLRLPFASSSHLCSLFFIPLSLFLPNPIQPDVLYVSDVCAMFLTKCNKGVCQVLCKTSALMVYRLAFRSVTMEWGLLTLLSVM